MCGIIGYIGPRETKEVLLEGLRRLEYRGYDSAGVALFHEGKVVIRRSQGKLKELERKTAGSVSTAISGSATPAGRPTENLLKPTPTPTRPEGWSWCTTASSKITLPSKNPYARGPHLQVGNGHRDSLPSDPEPSFPGGPSRRPCARLCLRWKVLMPIAVLYEGEKDKLIAARKESPLILGLGKEEAFVASDIPAILPYTRKMIFLEDGEMAVIQDRSFPDHYPRRRETAEGPQGDSLGPGHGGEGRL